MVTVLETGLPGIVPPGATIASRPAGCPDSDGMVGVLDLFGDWANALSFHETGHTRYSNVYLQE